MNIKKEEEETTNVTWISSIIKIFIFIYRNDQIESLLIINLKKDENFRVNKKSCIICIWIISKF